MVGVGCFLPTYNASGPLDLDAIRGVAVRAEELGLDHLWAGDHYVWNVGMISPWTVLAHVAALTRRIRLGTGVYLVTLRHPTITAKDVASVDVLSGGRVILGVGAGGDPDEYAAVGVPLAGRGRRSEEAVRALRGILGGRPQAFAGDHFTIPAFDLLPPPVQQPVPIWLGGRADAVVDRAARLADGWFPVWVSPERMRRAGDQIAAVRGSLEGFSLALNVFVHLGPSREEAGAAVAAHLRAAYGLPFDTFERYAAFGSAADVVEHLHPYVEAGVTDIALNLTGPPGEQLEALAAEVVPHLRG